MAIRDGPKRKSIWTSYDLRWKPQPDDFLGQTGDFSLVSELSRWLFDLAWMNSDDMSKMEKEWWIFHVTPGHIIIFLHLLASDLQPRIQYPLKRPGCGWSDSPLPFIHSAICTEHDYDDFWEFHLAIQKLHLQPVFSETHQRVVHRPAAKKES